MASYILLWYLVIASQSLPVTPMALYTMHLEVSSKLLLWFGLLWAPPCLYLQYISQMPPFIGENWHFWHCCFHLSSLGYHLISKICFYEWYLPTLNYGFQFDYFIPLSHFHLAPMGTYNIFVYSLFQAWPGQVLSKVLSIIISTSPCTNT